MTIYSVGLTRTNAQALCDALDVLDELPAAGTHFGGGIHVPMPPTWDGAGSPPPGWTDSHRPRQSRLVATEYAVDFTNETQRRRGIPAEMLRLAPGDRVLVASSHGSAVPLPDDYKGPGG